MSMFSDAGHNCVDTRERMNPRCPYSVVRIIGHRPDRPLVRPLDWRNVSGGRSRQLLRNMEHTQAVHAFVAALAKQADSLGWNLEQIDPPRRASRHFRHEHGDALRQSRRLRHPAQGPGDLALLPGVVAQGRASRHNGYPARPQSEVLLDLRYYSTRRPTDDHGVRGLREIAGGGLDQLI